MTVAIKKYSDDLKQRFLDEKERLKTLLPDSITIEHVGSSAVKIGGKNIVDILIGVSDEAEMKSMRDILIKNGYREGNDTHEDRVFLASREGETGEGDIHIHLCLASSGTYQNFIVLRDFLINNPVRAKEYFDKKHEFAKAADYDRKKYKALKSKYVSELLLEAKNCK